MSHCCRHHNCIEELKADHEIILAELVKLEADPAGYAKEFLKFTANFAEPHHHKEEEVLFPALERKGIPNQGGPIGVMLMEHETKRGYVKELAAGKIEAAANIISLLREHIAKENDILYPLAQQVLSEEELAAMADRCEAIGKG
ncbi:MAG: hemerythrin domain-containing protein [Candidatus Nealsonbacteria bacterium]|nr:hemerythrin domain-containing protein [Candidatus Nealsonbacteria bacterium]